MLDSSVDGILHLAQQAGKAFRRIDIGYNRYGIDKESDLLLPFGQQPVRDGDTRNNSFGARIFIQPQSPKRKEELETGRSLVAHNQVQGSREAGVDRSYHLASRICFSAGAVEIIGQRDFRYPSVEYVLPIGNCAKGLRRIRSEEHTSE